MLTAVLLLLAQPGDAVQTHDLGTMTWQRAKALEGRRVRVRFDLDCAPREWSFQARWPSCRSWSWPGKTTIGTSTFRSATIRRWSMALG